MTIDGPVHEGGPDAAACAAMAEESRRAHDRAMAAVATVCDQPNCVDPYGARYGQHYHCGRCDSGDVTSMYGHLRNGAWRCPAPTFPEET